VAVTETTKYDLMGAALTTAAICREIVRWIRNGGRVKKVSLRGTHAGQAAFEMKPRIDKSLFYVKVTLCELGEFDEHLLIVSAHPDH
jgi:hypothetical protein